MTDIPKVRRVAIFHYPESTIPPGGEWQDKSDGAHILVEREMWKRVVEGIEQAIIRIEDVEPYEAIQILRRVLTEIGEDAEVKANGELERRIKELEEEREACIRQCPAPTIAQAAAMTHGERFYIYTDELLAAAWAARVEGSLVGLIGKWYLNADQLGIERCENCKGEGDRVPIAGGVMNLKCPVCNGIGAVVKNE